MELEYIEVYEELFEEQDLLLERALEEKAKAQSILEEANEHNSQSPSLASDISYMHKNLAKS